MPPSWGANALLHPPRRPVTQVPTVKFEKVDLDVGIHLAGWLFRTERPRRGLVVYLHGLGDNRSSGISDRATLQCARVRRARLRQPRARRVGRRRLHVWVLRKERSEPGARQAGRRADRRVRRLARRGHRAAGRGRGSADRAGRRGGAHLGPQDRRHGARAVLREPRQHRRGLSHRREGGRLPGRRREPGGGGDEDSRPRPGDPRGRRSRDAASPLGARLRGARRTEEARPGSRGPPQRLAHRRRLEADRRVDRLPLAAGPPG